MLVDRKKGKRTTSAMRKRNPTIRRQTAARRRHVVKEKKQRRRFNLVWMKNHSKQLTKIALLLLMVGVAYIGYRLITNPSIMTINRVEVKGDLKLITREILQPIFKAYTETNLFLLDAEGLEKRLESEPWIRAASLYRKWPQTLIVQLEEQRPLAFWGEDKMVNSYGEVFDAILKNQIGIMPVLYNADDQGFDTIDNYKSVQEWVKDLPVGVEEFSQNLRGEWKLKLTNGIEVEVGRHEQKKRMRRFVIGYLKKLSSKEKRIKSIDLRYTNGFAVRWKR